MRKKWIIMASVALFVLVISLITSLYSWRISNDYQERVEQMEQAVREGDWERAQTLYEQMDQHWEQVRPTLQLWINHRDTDDISQTLLDLGVVLEARLVTESLQDLEALYEHANHLYHRDALTLSNLL